MTGYTGDILDRGRELAETRMTETIRGGLWTDSTDEITGDSVRSLSTLRYEGIAQVKYSDQQVTVSESAGQLVATQTVVLKVPVTAPILPEGDEVVVDASTSDGTLVNRRYRIDGAPAAGQTTSHRYPLKELS